MKKHWMSGVGLLLGGGDIEGGAVAGEPGESRKMEQAFAEPARYKQLLKELKGRACQGRNRQSFRQ